MAVKVFVPQTRTPEEHLQATRVEVTDGHLRVGADTNSGWSVVAIYAPGQWRNAVVVT